MLWELRGGSTSCLPWFTEECRFQLSTVRTDAGVLEKDARPQLDGQLSGQIVQLDQKTNKVSLSSQLFYISSSFTCSLDFFFSVPLFPPKFLGGQDCHEVVLTRSTFLRSKPGLRMPGTSSKRRCVQLTRSLLSSSLSR